jgi:hypothetical protein
MQPFWQLCFDTVLKKYSKGLVKDMKPKDYQALKTTFEGMEGSWEGLTDGNIDQWLLVKKICLSFVKVKKNVKKK